MLLMREVQCQIDIEEFMMKEVQCQIDIEEFMIDIIRE